MHVKVISAGSIGNHLTQASRRMGWKVTVTDIDSGALRRMREEIYPTRYGSWDDSIKLFVSGEEPKGEYDIIMIGTPPDVRMKVALQALKEKPKLILLEKPLCEPTAKGLKELVEKAKKQGTILLVGYDHGVAEASAYMAELLRKKIAGEILALDVEFREHWAGIFKAHPWLHGPADTYLGFISRGGGASGEHSHALHLWQYFAREAGLGTWKEVTAVYDMRKEGKVEYDAIAAFTLVTDKKKMGRVVQDVITQPTRKWARAQGREGFVEWICNGDPRGDVVRWKGKKDAEPQQKVFDKKRPDDFYRETLHIRDILEKKIRPSDSPLSIESGVRVIEVLRTSYPKRGTGRTRIKPL
ncbi:MAG: Gfo/Idh/MocA family oxidoreductase [Candidatus Kaiserbacteria bacterium]|nr:MAG: Gfo/Idh/MocA family oxidoreductase [Candidatus Kaiserbacteria bacterium]